MVKKWANYREGVNLSRSILSLYGYHWYKDIVNRLYWYMNTSIYRYDKRSVFILTVAVIHYERQLRSSKLRMSSLDVNDPNFNSALMDGFLAKHL